MTLQELIDALENDVDGEVTVYTVKQEKVISELVWGFWFDKENKRWKTTGNDDHFVDECYFDREDVVKKLGESFKLTSE